MFWFYARMLYIDKKYNHVLINCDWLDQYRYDHLKLIYIHQLVYDWRMCGVIVILRNKEISTQYLELLTCVNNDFLYGLVSTTQLSLYQS